MCRTCSPTKLHPQTNFSARERKDKYLYRHKPKCLDCMHPQCSNPACATCKICRDPKCTTGPSCVREPIALNPQQILKFGQKENYRCAACSDLLKCQGCGKMVSKDLTNKKSCHKVVKCMECLHPPCSVLTCTTCRSCRDPACKKVDCIEKPKSLNNSELNVFAGKDYFICQNCLFPRCENCNAEMTKITKERKRKSSSWKIPATDRTWTCQDCEIRDNYRKLVHHVGMSTA